MSAPYVPESAAELAGYLASVVEAAAKAHPDDEGLARGVAAHEAWTAQQEAIRLGRRCHRCGATTGLRLMIVNPLSVTYRQWECSDGCQGGTR